jgi:hypothetical protein
MMYWGILWWVDSLLGGIILTKCLFLVTLGQILGFACGYDVTAEKRIENNRAFLSMPCFVPEL